MNRHILEQVNCEEKKTKLSVSSLLTKIESMTSKKCLKKADAIMYADDTNIFLHHKNINALYDVAQKELVLVTNWLSANKLTLNINKTKFIVFTSNKKKGIKTDKSFLYVNEIPIEKVHAISFLGLLIDENLSWKPHMLTLLNKLRSFGVISKLKYCLSNQNFHYTRSDTPKRVTSWRGPSPRHCAGATQLHSKKCRNGGEPLATLCPI